MLPERKPFELLLDADEAGQSDEPAQLREFVRRCLIRRYPSFCEVPEAGPLQFRSGAIATAVAPIEPEHQIVVFGIGAMLRRKNEFKAAILSPSAVAKFLTQTAEQPPALHMAALREVQESLHATDPVCVFTAAQLIPLVTLGARNLILLAFPAMQFRRVDRGATDLLIINHLSDHRAFEALVAAVAATPPLTAGTIDSYSSESLASAPDAGTGAKIHVHLGSIAGDELALRVVDSHAHGRLVVLLHDPLGPPYDNSAANAAMAVEHNVSGLRVSRVRDVVPAVRRLLADVAMADLFRRNGDRVAGSFNAAIEERIISVMS